MKPVSLSRSMIAIFLASFILFGCSKKSEPQPNRGATTFRFTANGTRYVWNGDALELQFYGSIILKDNYTSSYHLNAIPMNGGVYQGIFFTIATPFLSETTYTYSPSVATTLDFANDRCCLPGNPNVFYGDFEIGDFATVRITKILDNYADGNFSGSFTIGGGSSKLNITDGAFENVKIVE